MQLDTALPWLALCLTRALASRLCARLLKHFGSPEARIESAAEAIASMRAACRNSAGRLQKRWIRTGRKGIGRDPRNSGLPALKLDRAGVPANFAANL